MTMVFIYVDRGDITSTGKGKPFRELIVSYRKVNHASDLGLARTTHSFTGSKVVAIREARDLAKKFDKKGYSTAINVTGCGKTLNGRFILGTGGKFFRTN